MARRKMSKHGSTTESLNEEFDLKEAVMTSIAESIGLIQAPNTESALPSGADSIAMSTPTSPLTFGQKGRRGPGSASIRSPFGGLSMLDITRSQASTLGGLQGEENASHTGTAAESTTGGVEDLENDVQILYFKAGSVLVKEGEANAGL
jgi:lysophospholipid hydrolase